MLCKFALQATSQVDPARSSAGLGETGFYYGTVLFYWEQGACWDCFLQHQGADETSREIMTSVSCLVLVFLVCFCCFCGATHPHALSPRSRCDFPNKWSVKTGRGTGPFFFFFSAGPRTHNCFLKNVTPAEDDDEFQSRVKTLFGSVAWSYDQFSLSLIKHPPLSPWVQFCRKHQSVECICLNISYICEPAPVV